MTPINELRNEHAAVKVALNILEHMVWEIDETGRLRYPEDAEGLIDFFSGFVDTCHHGKEERHLFPDLEKIGIPRDGGPIGVMLAEHETGRSHIRGMKQALADPGPESAAAFSHHAAAYVELLRLHIEKEDKVLFPLAEQRLSRANQADLSARFEALEKDLVGEGKHEVYHALIDRLAVRYLAD